jgi:hypothetical protein
MRELERIVHSLVDDRWKRRCAHRDAALSWLKVLDLTMREHTEWRARAERAEAKLRALQWQIDHCGCSESHIGELTYECDIQNPCGMCRLRIRAERAERSWHAVSDALGCEDLEPHTEANVVGRARELWWEVSRLRRAEAQLRDLLGAETEP